MENSSQNGLGEQVAVKTAIEAVKHIMGQTGDPTKFRRRQRGYVDWKFGELAEYLGFTGAEQYVLTVRRWYDYESKYKGACLLDETYSAFAEAQKMTTNHHHSTH